MGLFCLAKKSNKKTIDEIGSIKIPSYVRRDGRGKKVGYSWILLNNKVKKINWRNIEEKLKKSEPYWRLYF